MKLKEIHRTSTFAWSPTPGLPFLATGTAAGALDASFSNESQLEIWAPDFLDKDEYDLGVEGQHGPKGVVMDSSRFHRLAWGNPGPDRAKGVIAAGMENGDLALWDPEKILHHANATETLILRNSIHGGPVRGLDFNPIQTNLLSSGGIRGEVYVWDLKDPSKPYSPTPGTRSTKLDEITSLAWNLQVQYVLAGASSTGYTVVWDLRGKREVVALTYGGNQTMGGPGGMIGARRGMSDVAWHPDNATRLVTASEDDSSPVIMVWDLRNARAPEKILTGHEKGILSLSWCKQDADLLLSCGKDNRALCWNPQTSDIIGELPSSDNWAFQVDWCPRNPDLLATAFFDGTIGIHSIHSTNESLSVEAALQSDGADIFDVPGFSRLAQGSLSLKQPPKWLRRPTSNSWGYGGKLVTVSNLPSPHGKNQSSVVHIRKVVTEQTLVQRAKKFQTAVAGKDLDSFLEDKSGENEAHATASSAASWKPLLSSLFKADSRDQLVTLLGFSKQEIAARVAEAVENVKKNKATTSTIRAPSDDELSSEKPHGPVVSFAEPERSDSSDGDHDAASGGGIEQTPSEISASVASDMTDATRLADGESNATTVPSLFGDDGNVQDAAADFFSTITVSNAGLEARQVVIPHHNYGLDSSVAATMGSGPSSIASESFKNNVFKIYPNNESEIDRLVTKALVLGDFQSAVDLCLTSERYADAILLAVKGGPDLLQRTQKTYFDRQTSALPYLRLFQSIVTDDLADIVQNADLKEWQEIFVVLCTFAGKEDFPGLAESLGRRLEFQWTITQSSDEQGRRSGENHWRNNATLAYLAAGRLERLVSIWVEEMSEEEKRLLSDEQDGHFSRYAAHAHALQSLVEKVTVFRSAIDYVDEDLSESAANDRSFKLSGLYDRYLEYAEVLGSQGLVAEAAEFIRLVPGDYHGFPLRGSGQRQAAATAEHAGGAQTAPAVGGTQPGPQALTAASSTATISGAGYAAKPQPAAAPSAYTGYAPASHHAAAQPPTGSYTVAPQQAAYHTPAYGHYAPSAYQPTQAVGPSHQIPQHQHHHQQHQHQHQHAAGSALGAPPPLRTSSAAAAPPLRTSSAAAAPPPKRTENGGWNDAPMVPPPDRRSPATMTGAGGGGAAKLAAITSPFPNAPAAHYPSTSPANVPPPPRPGSVQAQRAPPPPSSGGRLAPGRGPGPGLGAGYPPPMARPSSGPPGHPPNAPPSRMVSPPQRQAPTTGQYAPPAPLPPLPPPPPPPPSSSSSSSAARPMAAQTPPPPPPGRGLGPPQGYPQAGQYGPGQPAAPQQQGQYAPPPSQQLQQQQQQQQQHLPPQQAQQPLPPPPGPYGPPGGVPTRVGVPVQAPLAGTAAAAAPPPPPPGSSPGRPAASVRAPTKTGPPPPKYPVGDRSHIPEFAMPAFAVISEQLGHLRRTTQQKRLIDDLERRINPLFDALNCETLSRPVVDQLLVLTRAMAARDREAALSIHVDLLTRGSQTDDIGLWMSGIKQLIVHL